MIINQQCYSVWLIMFLVILNRLYKINCQMPWCLKINETSKICKEQFAKSFDLKKKKSTMNIK